MQESDHPILIYPLKRGTTHEIILPATEKAKARKGKRSKVKGKSEEKPAFIKSGFSRPFAFDL
jgi:hypothetical protein